MQTRKINSLIEQIEKISVHGDDQLLLSVYLDWDYNYKIDVYLNTDKVFHPWTTETLGDVKQKLARGKYDEKLLTCIERELTDTLTELKKQRKSVRAYRLLFAEDSRYAQNYKFTDSQADVALKREYDRYINKTYKQA